MKSVITFNDQLGTLALGFSREGFLVKGLYLDYRDKYNVQVCEKNWDNVNVVSFSELLDNIENYDLEDVDCIAIQLNTQSLSNVSTRIDKVNIQYGELFAMTKILIERVRHKAVVLVFNYSQRQYVQKLCKETLTLDYQYAYKIFDAGLFTGFPIREKTGYLVAIRKNTYYSYSILDVESSSIEYSIQDFIKNDGKIDDWYNRVNPLYIENVEDINNSVILLWDSYRRCYKHCEKVTWNPRMLPLVCGGGTIRKITHREIARLKGIPEDYDITISNKQMAYKKLMYCSHVHMNMKIASSLKLGDANSFFSTRASQKVKILEETISSVFEKNGAEKLENNSAYSDIDFRYIVNGAVYNVCLKYFEDDIVAEAKIRAICRRISSYSIGKGTMVLVVANIMSTKLKEELEEEHQIQIWSIENILGLLGEMPKEKANIVSILRFDTSKVVAKIPELFDSKMDETIVYPIDYQEQLRKIPAGIENATLYENLCVDIMKHLFSDGVEFFEPQKTSSNGLYRFDFCGKVKLEKKDEFWDTIETFFQTKYVVFEFKNYANEITQKEIYTTEKYLYEKALRRVAIIVTRQGMDENAKKAARGSLREQGKLILCLSDGDVNKLIEMKQNGENPTNYLEAILDSMLIELEK